MELLKSTDMRESAPFHAGRYFLRLYGGKEMVRYWRARTQEFSKMQTPLVEKWFKPVAIPKAEDMQFYVADKLPEHVSFQEREILLRGVRLAMESLEEILRKA